MEIHTVACSSTPPSHSGTMTISRLLSHSLLLPLVIATEHPGTTGHRNEFLPSAMSAFSSPTSIISSTSFGVFVSSDQPTPSANSTAPPSSFVISTASALSSVDRTLAQGATTTPDGPGLGSSSGGASACRSSKDLGKGVYGAVLITVLILILEL